MAYSTPQSQLSWCGTMLPLQLIGWLVDWYMCNSAFSVYLSTPHMWTHMHTTQCLSSDTMCPALVANTGSSKTLGDLTGAIMGMQLTLTGHYVNLTPFCFCWASVEYFVLYLPCLSLLQILLDWKGEEHVWTCILRRLSYSLKGGEQQRFYYTQTCSSFVLNAQCSSQKSVN